VGYITVGIHFEVDGLLIASSLAGNRIELEFAHHSCAIILPGKMYDFGMDSATAIDHGALYKYSSRGDDIKTYGVYILRIEVSVGSYLTVDHLPYGGPHADNDLAEAGRVFDEAFKVAGDLLYRFIAQVRAILRQPWLGPTSTTPRTVWITDLLDAEGRRLAASFGRGGTLSLLDTNKALTEQVYRDIVGALSLESGPPLAETFLADALFLAWPAGRPDYRQALLLAAIACEVKIKVALRQLATPAQSGLLSLILDNPRDVSLAAVSLLDKALGALCGHSLRRENKELFKSATHLFEFRNRIAHRGGEGLSSQELIPHIATARAIFEYIDSVVSGVKGGEGS
jgi:hypothetical protein